MLGSYRLIPQSQLFLVPSFAWAGEVILGRYRLLCLISTPETFAQSLLPLIGPRVSGSIISAVIVGGQGVGRLIEEDFISQSMLLRLGQKPFVRFSVDTPG